MMAGIGSPTTGTPLSAAIMASRSIDGIGVAAVIQAGLVDAAYNSVG